MSNTIVNMITDPPTATLRDVDLVAQRVSDLLSAVPDSASGWAIDSLAVVNAEIRIARRAAESALYRQRLGRPALAEGVRAYNALGRARETLMIIEGGVRLLSQ
ncbi:MAG: hypothetical protein ACO4CT_18785 [Planctomycetota bacterium]